MKSPLIFLDLVVDRERLGNGTVQDLVLAVFQRVCLEGKGLEIGHFFGGNKLIGVLPFHSAACNFLGYIVTRKAYDHLEDFYHKLTLRFLDGLAQGVACLQGIGYKAVPYAVGRRFLVINNLDVIPFDAGNAKPELGSSQIN